MITAEENELLTHVGPGTPMGGLFRRYWLPALLSEELPEPDCPPVRVRLLGEDLVAFRDSQGRVGLLGEYCSHRRASLFYGRTENDSLTCVYHGWRYDCDGNILETPAEPETSMLRHHVKHKSYPCQEVNGLILTYMGPREQAPLLPAFPWLTLPRDHVCVGSKFLLECNWLQALEGDNDSIHTPYLHRRAGRGSSLENVARRNPAAVDVDVHPDWGVRATTSYRVDDEQLFVRTNTFLMPCIGNTPRGRGEVNEAVHTIYQVPADDYTNWRYDFESYWDRPVDSSYALAQRREVGPGFQKLMNRANDYLIDRARQKSGEIYCGVDAGNHTQDAMVTESMGRITDRTEEHLGTSDMHVVAVREFLLKAVRDFQRGEDPPGVVQDPAKNDIGNLCHMLTAVIPAGADWKALLPQK